MGREPKMGGYQLMVSYVENIFFAKPGDYKKATVKIFDGGWAASFVELPVVRGC